MIVVDTLPTGAELTLVQAVRPDGRRAAAASGRDQRDGGLVMSVTS